MVILILSEMENADLRNLLQKVQIDGDIKKNKDEYKFKILTKSAPQILPDKNKLRQEGWLSYNWRNRRSESISWRHFFLVGLSMDPNWSRSTKRTLRRHDGV